MRKQGKEMMNNEDTYHPTKESYDDNRWSSTAEWTRKNSDKILGYNTGDDYSFIKYNYRDLLWSDASYNQHIFGPYDSELAYDMAVAHGYDRQTCNAILKGKVYYNYEGKLREYAAMKLDSDDNDSDTSTNTEIKRGKNRQGTKANTVSDITFDTEPITDDSFESSDGNNDKSPPPELFILSQCLMTNTRTNAFPHMRIDRYYSLNSKLYVKFTEEITKKRKNPTDEKVNDAGHTTRKRKHNNATANVSTDGLRKMEKDTELKFKLMLVATMMKNRINVHNEIATTEIYDDNDDASSTTSGTKTTKTKTKMTNKSGVVKTTHEMEQTTTSSNNQKATRRAIQKENK